jgi:hypothetical protein
MNQEEKQLFHKFEKELWLFLDGDLPESRMIFWKQKIDELPELKYCIDEYRSISDAYAEELNIDIPEYKFDKMISKAISKISYFENIKLYIKKMFSTESEFVFGKIAFASALIIAAIFISIISNKTNPITNMKNTINHEVFDWDADFVDDQISKVGTLLKLTKDEDYRKYYKYKLTTNSVDKNINLINGNIETLKEEINNKEL